MRTLAIAVAVCALCALAVADDVPAALFPCSFRASAHMNIVDTDGEVIATTINEMIHDNTDNWVWKSQLSGNAFIQAIVPDHEWSQIWRQDLPASYREDVKSHKCYVLNNSLTPYKWIENQTYGIVWFDEPLEFEGKDAVLYTGVAGGQYSHIDYELVANFYVVDGNIALINGTVTGIHREIDVRFYTTSIFYEHNKPIDPKVFAINRPCDPVDPPAEPSEDFKNKCYSGAFMAQMSWLALLAAILAVILSF